MSADVIHLAGRVAAHRRRLFDHGHSVSSDGEDYGHERCPRCLGATYTGRELICPVCGARACVCYGGKKRVTLAEYLDEFGKQDDPKGAA